MYDIRVEQLQIHYTLRTLFVTGSDGQPRQSVQYRKDVKGFRAKTLYEPKTYQFREALMESIMRAAKTPASAITVDRVRTSVTLGKPTHPQECIVMSMMIS